MDEQHRTIYVKGNDYVAKQNVEANVEGANRNIDAGRSRDSEEERRPSPPSEGKEKSLTQQTLDCLMKAWEEGYEAGLFHRRFDDF